MLFTTKKQEADETVIENVEPENMSIDSEALMLEAALLDLGSEELQTLLEDTQDVNLAIQDNVVLERTIVKLDKAAKLSRNQKMAIFTIAKEKNDPKFKKLQTIWKWERYLENFLLKKYGNEGMRRAKVMLKNQGNSKSKMVKKAVEKAKQQLTPEKLTQPKEKIGGKIK